ncbi:MAG: hypothetical protein OXC82_11440, partial [Rhodobacteraceae bacterium]|nr:hypothetical protein [Paracoccaceae bacterium]
TETPPNGGPWAAPTPTDGPAPCPAMWSPSPAIGGGRWNATWQEMCESGSPPSGTGTNPCQVPWNPQSPTKAIIL